MADSRSRAKLEPTRLLNGALTVGNVTKVYRGGHVANDAVSLEIRPREVFGLLGPNGAGKTTLVKQIIGLLKPTSGAIRLGGTDLVEHPDLARKLCSYLPQAPLPIEPMRAREAIELIGRIRGGDVGTVRQRTQALIDALDLGEWRDTVGLKLSGGVRRLVGFCAATVWPGAVVILDEPTNDVDPLRRRLLWKEIRHLADYGAAVLLVTHNVLEAERVVDRLAIIDRGRVRLAGTPAEIKSADRDRLRVRITLEPEHDELPAPPFVTREAKAGRRWIGTVKEADSADALVWARELVCQRIAEEYELAPTSLDDAYLRIVGNEDGSKRELENEFSDVA